MQLEIKAPVPTSDFVADITFSDTVMVSLDCSGCSRCHRSVVLDKSGFLSYCMSTKHRFTGQILQLKSTRNEDSSIATGIYLIEYDFETFEDAKYPDRKPSPETNWARVKFTIRCKCGSNVSRETQNNQVRPFDVPCDCGAILVRDVEEIPKIKVVR